MEHHFNIEDAQKYGIECAILLYNIRYWVNKNKANGKHFYDGRYWTYNSAKAFSELFPYLSKTQISRHLRKLEDMGVLVSGNYNSVAYDKTKWYTIIENPSSKMNNDDSILYNDGLEMNNGGFKNEQPIPYNKPDSKPHIKNSSEKSNFKKWSLEDFQNEIRQHRGAAAMSQDEAMNFYNYWSESGNGKMRFQLEKTWETAKRMATWQSRSRTQINGQKQQGKTVSAAKDYLEGLINEP